MCIRPIIGYGLPFWSPNDTQYTKFDSVLAKPLKRVLGITSSSHTHSILTHLSIPSTSIWKQQLTISFIRRLSILHTPFITILPIQLPLTLSQYKQQQLLLHPKLTKQQQQLQQQQQQQIYSNYQ